MSFKIKGIIFEKCSNCGRKMKGIEVPIGQAKSKRAKWLEWSRFCKKCKKDDSTKMSVIDIELKRAGLI